MSEQNDENMATKREARARYECQHLHERTAGRAALNEPSARRFGEEFKECMCVPFWACAFDYMYRIMSHKEGDLDIQTQSMTRQN